MSKIFSNLFYFISFYIILFNFSPAFSADKETQKLARFLTDSSTTIAGKNKVGANVVMEWKSNKEVIEVSSYSDIKRVVAIETAISYLGKNETTIFPEITSSNHAIVFLATRLTALTYFSSLIGSSKNDLVVKDYIDSEIADIQMMLNGTVNYGAMYLQSRKNRDDKKAMFLLKNYEYTLEKIKLMTNEPNISNYLANKTFLISLFKVCTSIPQSCSKL